MVQMGWTGSGQVWHLENARTILANGIWPRELSLGVYRLDPSIRRNVWRGWGVEQLANDGNESWNGITSFAGWSLGRPANNPSGLRCDLRCFALVNGLISDEDAERFEGWAVHTFGMTDRLPADHPYRNSPPLV